MPEQSMKKQFLVNAIEYHVKFMISLDIDLRMSLHLWTQRSVWGAKIPINYKNYAFSARTQARDGLIETRRALRALRTDEQYIKNGIQAIYKICAVFHKVTGIDISIESGNIPTTFGPEIDLAVYRLVQEALTNAIRHGRASAVKIYFGFTTKHLKSSFKTMVLEHNKSSKVLGFQVWRNVLAILVAHSRLNQPLKEDLD